MLNYSSNEFQEIMIVIVFILSCLRKLQFKVFINYLLSMTYKLQIYIQLYTTRGLQNIYGHIETNSKVINWLCEGSKLIDITGIHYYSHLSMFASQVFVFEGISCIQ